MQSGSLKGIYSLKHEGVDAQAWGTKKEREDDVSDSHKHCNYMLQNQLVFWDDWFTRTFLACMDFSLAFYSSEQYWLNSGKF